MSIEEPNVVDAIGVDEESGKIVLTISDHLDWSDTDSHVLALQEKLNTYIAFVESGELGNKYPDAAGRPVVIAVVGRVRRPKSAQQFFTKVKPILASAGIELHLKVLAEDGEPSPLPFD
jgi:hypothetical protein